MYYLRDKINKYLIVICSLSFSLQIPLDERLVPISRLDYQNIILCVYIYVYVSLLSTKSESGFCPRKQKNRNNFQSPNNTSNSSFLFDGARRLRFFFFIR